MRVVVCVRPASDGQIGPFEASAYEAALRIPNAEVILLSMVQEKGGEELLRLTRLGAREAYHLCDRAFAGSDTLATTYTLSCALQKLSPDLVICGRQTMEG
ncbi:MAG: electron transfer flavoprotein beta subunit/FixA family protein, partial [Clostridia bacterium]|nr:electron transfer flavoprotein beta subunit/FixA family protein [Clostridia bacterium]